jgi:hypothetical protein
MKAISPKHENAETRWESEVSSGYNNSEIRTVTAPRCLINEYMKVYL